MVQVVPINDERLHESGTECWCKPRVEWAHPTTGLPYDNGPLVYHHAADCREMVEKWLGEQLSPEKVWVAVQTD